MMKLVTDKIARDRLYGMLVVCAMLALATWLSGCTLLGDIGDRAANRIGKGVKTYCEETIPDVREAFREKVNAAATPHSVLVDCFDGPVLTTEPTP